MVAVKVMDWPGLDGLPDDERAMAVVARLTVKKRSTGAAAAKSALPACEALRLTIPAPLIVTVPALIDAGPDNNSKATGKLDDELAWSVKGASPKVRSGGAAKVIVWPEAFTANVRSTFAAASKLPSPACVALTVTLPVPLRVTVFPFTDAGPESSSNETGRLEDAFAVSAKGASPKARSAKAKVIVWPAFLTVKLRSTLAALSKLLSPACMALTVTLPAPLIVSVLPLIVAGPDSNSNETGRFEDAVALNANGASPKLRSAKAKVMACAAFLTAKVRSTLAAASKLLSPVCVALTVILPAPLIVSVLPLIVAGPDSNSNDTGRFEDAVALKPNGASPKVRSGNANVITWVAFFTRNDLSTPGAASKLLSPACVALTVTLPVPVTVKMSLLTLAGPEIT